MRRSWTLLLPSVLCLPLACLQARWRERCRAAVGVPWLHGRGTAFERAFVAAGIPGLVEALALVCGAGPVLFLLASLLGFARRTWALGLLRRAYIGVYASR